MERTAIYIRVSSKNQKTDSQLPDLQEWAEQHEAEGDIKFFTEKQSGKSMNRPIWEKIQGYIEKRKIQRLVVWRLDRLGRTASGLTALFDLLNEKRIKFISIRDNIDLSTPSGKLIACVLASVASYENEVRSERVRTGQAVARAHGVKWGGSEKGRLCQLSREQARMIVKMKKSGESIAGIARANRTSRQTVYRILQRYEEGVLKIK